jgi:tRNA-intron endonuclease
MSVPSQEKLKFEVHVIGWKSIVMDVERSVQLFKMFLGRPLGISKPDPNTVYRVPLVLSMYEVLYLCEKGFAEPMLSSKKIDCKALEKYFVSMMPKFKRKYLVFKDLRQRGYIVRSGMKFGTDFTVYELGPGLEHAPYVVTVASTSDRLKAVDIVGLGRLSHSVRKKSVLAIVDEEKSSVNYIVFKWVKV